MRIGYLFAILSFVLYGVCPVVFPRVIGLPAPLITSLATVAGALGFAAACGRDIRREAWRLGKAAPRRVLAFGLMTALCMFTYQWAMQLTTVANAAIIGSMHPFLTCIVALPAFAGRPRPSASGYAALLLGAAGITAYLLPQTSLLALSLPGIALSVLYTACYSGYDVLMDTMKVRTSPEAMLLASLVVGAVSLAPVPMWYGLQGLTAAKGAAVLLFGALNVVGANHLYLLAAKRIPTAHVSMLSYLMAPISIAVGWLLFGEALTAPALLGSAAVLVSAALVVRDQAARTAATVSAAP